MPELPSQELDRRTPTVRDIFRLDALTTELPILEDAFNYIDDSIPRWEGIIDEPNFRNQRPLVFVTGRQQLDGDLSIPDWLQRWYPGANPEEVARRYEARYILRGIVNESLGLTKEITQTPVPAARQMLDIFCAARVIRSSLQEENAPIISLPRFQDLKQAIHDLYEGADPHTIARMYDAVKDRSLELAKQPYDTPASCALIDCLEAGTKTVFLRGELANLSLSSLIQNTKATRFARGPRELQFGCVGGVEEFFDRLAAIQGRASSPQERTLQGLVGEGVRLIDETLVVWHRLAGSQNALKLHEALQQSRTKLTSNFGNPVTLGVIMNIANLATDILNKNSEEALDRLAPQVASLPEAFRRLMLVACDGEELDNAETRSINLMARFDCIELVSQMAQRDPALRGGKNILSTQVGTGKVPSNGHTYWRRWERGYGIIS